MTGPGLVSGFKGFLYTRFLLSFETEFLCSPGWPQTGSSHLSPSNARITRTHHYASPHTRFLSFLKPDLFKFVSEVDFAPGPTLWCVKTF